MRKKSWKSGLSLVALGLAACTNEPVEVASNHTEALVVDKVDILLVVDDSNSMQSLQSDLPGLLDKLVAGSDKPGAERPALSDVHLAVVSTDMGVGVDTLGIHSCSGLGDDGLFISLSAEDIERCETATPSYLSFEGSSATATTIDTVSCIPELGNGGCGFEQPLESGLKALWSSNDDSVTFAEGTGHGGAENAGFLRNDSLLVVVVLSDEDDCSAEDTTLFSLQDPELMSTDLNLRCPTKTSYLYDVQRYVDGLKHLRPGNDHVLFVALAGIPPELVSAEAHAAVDFDDADAVADYYDTILDDARMQNTPDPTSVPGDGHVLPVCDTPTGRAMPARRLVQVAKSFGKAGVLGSVCADSFGDSMAAIIRAAADNL